MIAKLPPSLEGLASYLDAQCHRAAQHGWAAQPKKVRDIYNYALCLMMMEAGVMEQLSLECSKEALHRRPT